MTKTHEKLKKRMPRSSEDFAIEKGRCERWKSMDPVFINLSVAYFPPIRSHEYLLIRVMWRRCLLFVSFFLETQHKILALVPTQNDGMPLNIFSDVHLGCWDGSTDLLYCGGCVSSS